MLPEHMRSFSDKQLEAISKINKKEAEFLLVLHNLRNDLCPEVRSFSLAVNHLEDAATRAIKSVADGIVLSGSNRS